MVQVTVGANDITDWISALSALAAAGLTGALVIFARQQLIHLRQELKESRRPILQIVQPPGPGFTDDGGFFVEVRNLGTGPALKVFVIAEVTMTSDGATGTFIGYAHVVGQGESEVARGRGTAIIAKRMRTEAHALVFSLQFDDIFKTTYTPDKEEILAVDESQR